MSPGPIAVIGAGSTGLALVADLSSRGFDVAALVDRDSSRVEALRSRAAVRLTGILGTARLPMPLVTTDVTVVKDCRYVLLATTADAHREVARSLAPWMDRSHTVLLVTGYVGGSRIVQDALGARRPSTGDLPRVLELNSTPHLSCSARPGEVHVAAAKRWFEVASHDAEATVAEAPGVAELFPHVVQGEDALASSLNNPNPVAHVPAYLLNVMQARRNVQASGPQELGGAFYLSDFVGADVEALRVRLEDERVHVMHALGLGDLVVGRAEFAARAYPAGSREVSPPRLGRTFPRRLVTEDVPCGLVPLESLATGVHVDVPVTTALITLAGVLEGCDWRTAGRRAADVLPARVRAERERTSAAPYAAIADPRPRVSGVQK